MTRASCLLLTKGTGAEMLLQRGADLLTVESVSEQFFKADMWA